MVLQTENASQKKQFPLEIYRRMYSVGDSGISSKYFLALGKMPTDSFRL
jgi:hypothetical protein